MLSIQIEQLTEADRCQSRVESHFLHSFGSRFSAHSWDGEGVHVAQERKPLEGSGLYSTRDDFHVAIESSVDPFDRTCVFDR